MAWLLRKARLIAAAALVALALAAVGCDNSYDWGVSAFAEADDGTVLAITARGGASADGSVAAWSGSPDPPDGEYGYSEYKSADGGLSWSPNPDSAGIDIQPSESAETPRGVYAIGDFGVERIGAGGLRETVYSTEHLRGDANEWLQNHATSSLGRRLLATRPSAVFHHAESGNVIVAMGIQGAAVETPDGRWRRAAAGPYAPTDFSLRSKARAFWERAWFIGAIAAAVSLFALTVAAAASACERGGMKRGTAVHIGIILAIPVAAILGVALGASQTLAVWGVLTYLFAMLAGAVMPWIMILIASTFLRRSPDRHDTALIGCVWPLPIVVALAFPLRFGLFNGVFGDFYTLAVIAAASIALIPPFAYHARSIGRRSLPFALAFLGMNALIWLAFAAWLTLNLNLLATQMAIAILVGLAAVVLVRHVRGGRPYPAAG